MELIIVLVSSGCSNEIGPIKFLAQCLIHRKRSMRVKYCKAINIGGPMWWDYLHFNLNKISLTLLLHMLSQYKSRYPTPESMQCKSALRIRIQNDIYDFNICIPWLLWLFLVEIAWKYPRKYTQTEDDKSKETKRGNELFFVHMETWLVFGNILFQMRKLNYNENLIQFPVGRGMTGPSLWMEKWRKQGDDPRNVITIN